MKLVKLIGRCAAAIIATTLLAPVSAQTYPDRPVHFVLPYSVGSGPDAVVRWVGEQLDKEWDQKTIVENKPGADGWLAAGEVKRAKPDGYRLLVVDNTHMTLQPHLYKQMPFSPTDDFVPVSPLYSTYFFIVVSANSPWNNAADLIAAAKAKNGQLTYGTWGMGSVAHIGTAMLETATGTHMTHVPFKELPQLYNAVATGEVDWAFGTAATVRPLYDAKKVKLLALAAPKRLAGYENIPTVSEAGGPPNFQLQTWVGIYAPKGTPEAIISNLNNRVTAALNQPKVRSSLAGFGFQPWAAPAGDLAATAQEDTKRYATVVKQAGIKIE